MFPRGIPSAALPVAVTSALRPGQLPRQPHLRLVVTRILRPPHPARPAGRRNPPPRFRSASPPPGSPPTPSPRRSSAPRPAASCSCLTPCLRPPRIPSQRSGNCASGTSFVSSTSHARAATSGRYGVKCCPRHSRRFRAPIVACAAWWPGSVLNGTNLRGFWGRVWKKLTSNRTKHSIPMLPNSSVALVFR